MTTHSIYDRINIYKCDMTMKCGFGPGVSWHLKVWYDHEVWFWAWCVMTSSSVIWPWSVVLDLVCHDIYKCDMTMKCGFEPGVSWHLQVWYDHEVWFSAWCVMTSSSVIWPWSVVLTLVCHDIFKCDMTMKCGFDPSVSWDLQLWYDLEVWFWPWCIMTSTGVIRFLTCLVWHLECHTCLTWPASLKRPHSEIMVIVSQLNLS